MTSPTTLPPVFILTDDVRLPDAIAVAQTMPQHWGLIFRHYKTKERHSLADRLGRVCRDRGVLFLVAGDWRLACDVGADGVHVPESILKTGLVSPMLAATRSRILTASAHGTAGLHRASAVGADAVFLSPVHATASHTDVRPIGAMPFSAMIRHCRVPVYGLGGIDFSDVMQLQAMGAAGIAGISLAHGLL